MPCVYPPMNAILVLAPAGWSLVFFPLLFFNVGQVATTTSYAAGYINTLTLPPMDFGGKFVLNFSLTTPLLPCGLVTLLQMHL